MTEILILEIQFINSMPGHSEGSMKKAAESSAAQEELTEKELDVITTVFRSYETGLREATINPKVNMDNTLVTNIIIPITTQYFNETA